MVRWPSGESCSTSCSFYSTFFSLVAMKKKGTGLGKIPANILHFTPVSFMLQKSKSAVTWPAGGNSLFSLLNGLWKQKDGFRLLNVISLYELTGQPGLIYVNKGWAEQEVRRVKYGVYICALCQQADQQLSDLMWPNEQESWRLRRVNIQFSHFLLIIVII